MKNLFYILAALIFLDAGSAMATSGPTTPPATPVTPQPAQFLHQTLFVSGGTETAIIACGKFKAVNIPGSTTRMNVSDCGSARLPPGLRVK